MHNLGVGAVNPPVPRGISPRFLIQDKPLFLISCSLFPSRDPVKGVSKLHVNQVNHWKARQPCIWSGYIWPDLCWRLIQDISTARLSVYVFPPEGSLKGEPEASALSHWAPPSNFSQIVKESQSWLSKFIIHCLSVCGEQAHTYVREQRREPCPSAQSWVLAGSCQQPFRPSEVWSLCLPAPQSVSWIHWWYQEIQITM